MEWIGFLWIAALLLSVLGFSGWAGTASFVVQALAVVFAILLAVSYFLSRSTPWR